MRFLFKASLSAYVKLMRANIAFTGVAGGAKLMVSSKVETVHISCAITGMMQ
jgi:hypothetical protein